MKLPISLLTLFCAMILTSLAQAEILPRASAERMEQRIIELSAFGRNSQGGVNRVAFSQHDIDARHYIGSLMTQAGLEINIDSAGNLIGRREGQVNLPPILFGSHIDSVPGGGNYDGDVGVIGAIEVAQLLHEKQITTRHPLEIIVFADEEGGLIGSRAMVGKLGEDALQSRAMVGKLGKDALQVISHSGMSIADGIRAIGGDPENLQAVRREPGDVAAFIELHIEQGAVLDQENIDVGVVTGIVGIKWWDILIEGVANHAGTTPMNKRRDALLSAAELTLAINEVITSAEGAQVGTVGRIHAEPGAPNVIPGKVIMSLEIRDLSDVTIWDMFRGIEERALEISQRRGTSISFEHIEADAEPALTDPRLRAMITRAAQSLGLSYKLMPSGAGHDAQDMAQIAPTGMIFVPSVDGISHAPAEYTTAEDMANGADVLLRTVLALDQSALGQK